jgi:hypothetical protein
MRLLLRLLFLLGLSVLLVSGEANSQTPPPVRTKPVGLKMTVRDSMGGSEAEETVYFRPDARRREFRSLTASKFGPHLALIARCDSGTMLDLNLDQREYESRPYPPPLMAQAPPPAVPPGPPTSRIEETTVDTGDRTDFFGHQARHVVTTRKETPLPGSHRYVQEVVTDGWYIDIDTEISCEPWWRLHREAKGFAYLTAGNVVERVELVQKGKAETGFDVESKTVEKSLFILQNGTTRVTTSKSRTKVIDFKEGPLEAGVFEIPAGFKKVEHISRAQPEEDRNALSAGWQQFVLTVEDLFH